ncbi:MAG: hypothetical protein FJX78_04675 [Armatimonadetes bacterium]|nr:hypothetical protein [Armatimonadota bacterium]
MKFAVLILFLVFVASFGIFLSNAGRSETILVRFIGWLLFDGPYPNGISLAVLAGALFVWIPMAVQTLFLQGRVGWLRRQVTQAQRAAEPKSVTVPPRATTEEGSTPRT